MDSTVSWIIVGMAAKGETSTSMWEDSWLPLRKIFPVGVPCPPHPCHLVQVRQVKLVGELYNYRLVDSVLIFDSLYQCPDSHLHKAIQMLGRSAFDEFDEFDKFDRSSDLQIGVQLPSSHLFFMAHVQQLHVSLDPGSEVHWLWRS